MSEPMPMSNQDTPPEPTPQEMAQQEAMPPEDGQQQGLFDDDTSPYAGEHTDQAPKTP